MVLAVLIDDLELSFLREGRLEVMVELHVELRTASIAVDVCAASRNLCLGELSILGDHVTGMTSCIANANNVDVGRVPAHLIGSFEQLLGERIDFLGLAR